VVRVFELLIFFCLLRHSIGQLRVENADCVLAKHGAQATGQGTFPLEATEKDTFRFNQAGIVLMFNPEAKTMVLKQGGGEYKFTKD
jgi:hypothetical protein